MEGVIERFIISIYRMELTINQVDFQVAISALREQSVCRLQQVNTMQIDFLRQFQCQHVSPESHARLVYHIRRMIFGIQDIYKGIGGYFTDLHIEFVFDLFRRIQLLMVSGYNFLAQALLLHIDNNESLKQNNRSVNGRQALLRERTKIKGHSPSRQLQHCDYAIGWLEGEEAKLTQEMHKIQESLLMSRGLVENIGASKAVKELTQIKEKAEVTLENTEKIFEQAYQLKYFQFKTYLSKLLKPQDIATQFCDNIRVAMHDKFTSGVKRSAQTLYQVVHQQKANMMREQSAQTDDALFSWAQKKTTVQSKNGQKMQNLLLRERKINQKLLGQVQVLRREVVASKQQQQRLQAKSAQFKKQMVEYRQNYAILTRLYEERRQEMLRLENECAIAKAALNDLQLYRASRMNAMVSVATQIGELKQIKNTCVQVCIDQQNQIVSAMRGRIERLRARLIQYELKDKEKKKTLEENRPSEKRSSKRVLPSYSKRLTMMADPAILKFDEVKQKKKIGSNMHFSRNSRNSSARSSDRVMTVGGEIMQSEKQVPGGERSSSKQFKLSKFLNIPFIDSKDLSSRKSISSSNSSSRSSRSNSNHIEAGVQTQSFNEENQKISQETQTDGIDFRYLSERENLNKDMRDAKLKGMSRQQRMRFKFGSSIYKGEGFIKDLCSLGSIQGQFRMSPARESEQSQWRSGRKSKYEHFESLNLNGELGQNALIKRNILQKQYKYPLSKRPSKETIDLKNMTCAAEILRSVSRGATRDQGSHMLLVDRVNFNHINRGGTHKKFTADRVSNNRKLKRQQTQHFLPERQNGYISKTII